MKYLSHVLLIALCATWLCTPAVAQQAPLSKEHIALTPIIVDDNIPASARSLLGAKMNQIAAKNGCAATANSRFVITCSVSELTKDVTATVPAMHAYTLGVTFYVGDGVEGRLFSSATVEAKGAGQTPEKAYISAIKAIRIADPTIKSMVDKGKQEIIDYYAAMKANSSGVDAMTSATTQADDAEEDDEDDSPAGRAPTPDYKIKGNWF